eukprot:3933422-Rhodomonas_salina.6
MSAMTKTPESCATSCRIRREKSKSQSCCGRRALSHSRTAVWTNSLSCPRASSTCTRCAFLSTTTTAHCAFEIWSGMSHLMQLHVALSGMEHTTVVPEILVECGSLIHVFVPPSLSAKE